MRRLNLALSDPDYLILARVAGVARIPVGTWARLLIVRSAVNEERKLRESGELAEFEQLTLFTNKKARGRK